MEQQRHAVDVRDVVDAEAVLGGHVAEERELVLLVMDGVVVVGRFGHRVDAPRARARVPARVAVALPRASYAWYDLCEAD